jgi:glycosyltransferase involved in cell wall biosynthesis
MSKGKILFVTKYHFTRHTGGAELKCWIIAEEFARRGWDVHYVSENDRPDKPRELAGVKLRWLPENPNWRTCNRDGLARVMREVNPDVVYNRVFDLYTAHAVELAPKRCVTIWAAAAALDGSIWPYIKAMYEARPLRQFLVKFPQALYVRNRALKAARRATLALVQIEEHGEVLRKQGIQPELVHNNIVIGEEDKVQTHEGTPTILWVGSVKPWKRPEIFFELCKRCADLEARFVMIGQVYSPQSEAHLKIAQRELRNFEYAGFVPPDRIREFYRKAHVFVSTSLAEGFPNTFTEAWMVGVPVLSLDVNPNNMLTSGGLGVYVTNVDELERELRKLLAAPDLRREIGARAREFTLKEFDLKANVTKLEKLIEQARKKISPSL